MRRWTTAVAVGASILVLLLAATVTGAAAPPAATVGPSTTVGAPTTVSAPPTSRSSPTTSASTTTTTTSAPTTTTAPPPNRLAGVNWIQATYPSPCGEGNIQLVGGSALAGASRVVLEDVRPLDPAAGLALAFLSCRGAGEATTQRSVAVVEASANGVVQPRAGMQLGPNARVVELQPPTLIVENPAGPRRRSISAGARGFTVTSDVRVDSPGGIAAAASVVGNDGGLVRRSVPPAALCFHWDNVWLSPAEPAEPAPPTEPSAELQTLRLALIHLTGEWIDPSGEMTPQMAEVTRRYQESRGLAVDGLIGRQTTGAIAAELGCSERTSFAMVIPTGLGPRNFDSVASLVRATDRFARTDASGYGSIDQLLTDAGWNGRQALFLGCQRRDTPPAGVTCSWSGTTPLQLIGLVDDPSQPGVHDFSILYARSGRG